MPRRKFLSLLLSLLLLLSALGGGAPVAASLPADAQTAQACPCQPDSPCQCPADAPCQVSQHIPDSTPMVVSTLDWPQAPALCLWDWVASPPGPVWQLTGPTAPPAPPPEALYLQKSSLLI